MAQETFFPLAVSLPHSGPLCPQQSSLYAGRMIGRLLSSAMRVANFARHTWWRLTDAKVDGVHGLALTPTGTIVLVRLTYATGWRVPGGAKGKRETPETGVLRELKEEIGLTAWSSVEPIWKGESRDLGWVERDALFVVRDVTYLPRRSLEIAEIGEFSLSDLPDDLSPITKKMIGVLADFAP